MPFVCIAQVSMYVKHMKAAEAASLQEHLGGV